MPSLESLAKRYQDTPFKILLVDVGESAATVRSFIRKSHYGFTPALDENSVVAQRYGVRSHPVKFLLDRQGNLLAKAIGYRDWDTDAMHALVEALNKKR